MAASLSPPIPNPWSLLRESAGFLSFARLALEAGSLRQEPAGDGSTVIVLPGFGADDLSTWPLRRFLSDLGYQAQGWGLGSNRASVPDAIESIGANARRIADATGRPVALVGWSLGGYIAREAARDHPGAIRRVVTLGSPVIGGPKYTTVAPLAPLQGWDLDEIEAEVERRKSVPLRVPVTAIYSRRDAVVDWRACIDPENGAPIEHVEVDAGHIALGFEPAVYRIVARRLAAAP